MNFFHLSHTDLDGYSCQFITKKYFPHGHFFNANYGMEVKLSLDIILQKLASNSQEKALFLISDLNLNEQESKMLHHEIAKLNENGANIELLLLDHHITGEKSAKKYEWYFLDVQRCAAKIVYDYFKKRYKALENDTQIKDLIDAVNAVDIWLEHQSYEFEYGKVLMRLVSKASEINASLFPNENRDFRLFLLEKACGMVHMQNRTIALDDAIHFLKKEYLSHDNTVDTIDNLSSNFLVHTIQNKKEELTIYYKQHKGILTYNLGSISIPANAFLKANKSYDFFIDMSRRGAISLRADNKIDVSRLASKLAGGGGHPNASGGKFRDFQETIIYKEVKEFIQKKLDKLS